MEKEEGLRRREKEGLTLIKFGASSLSRISDVAAKKEKISKKG